MQPDYRSIFESLPGLYLVLSPELKIVAVSDLYLKATLTKRDYIINKGIFEVFPDNPEDPTADGVSMLRTSLNRVLKNKIADAMSVQKYDIREPGEQHFKEKFWSPLNTPVFDDKNNLRYIIHQVEDVTEFVQLKNNGNEEMARVIEKKNIELNKTKNELSDALAKEKDLNELKSKFVTMASHEFRTPLSTILSSSYLASKYSTTEEAPQREKHLQRIISAVSALTDILDDFLSLGKIEEGKISVTITEFDLKEVITAQVDHLQAILKKGQTISYEHTGETRISSDFSMMKNIIVNLLSNAIKFSPEDSEINIGTNCTGDAFIIKVTDKGIGISDEDQKWLYDRFFRAGNAANIQGTGLGLHIVYKFIELLRGTIICQSQLGHGTTFTITLPQAG